MGKLLLSPKISDAFNNYFIDVGPSLSKNTPETFSIPKLSVSGLFKMKAINSCLPKETSKKQIKN